MKSRVRVSIVIPAYNEESYLPACLDAIAAQTVKPYEVIVVDNNSTDRTAEIACRYSFVRLIREPRQGRVFARNAGFQEAQGDVIGRIDADIVLPLHWVEHVSQFYRVPRNQSLAWSGSGYFANMRFPRVVSWGYGLLAFRFNRILMGHYTLWGSNMALTRKQWRVISSRVCLRNDIHEDLDLAIHLHRAGFGISYDTSIKTNAHLRRVRTGRKQLWGYLLWWPQTLRVHHCKAWVFAWLIVAGLYVASYFWVFSEWLARRLGRAPLPD